jgi:hypothetical protein
MVARARWPRVPIVALAVASVAPDFVDVALAALRICAPAGVYSHSLIPALLIAAFCAVIVGMWQRSASAALVIAMVVLLHLPADFITGLKVFWPGGPIVGLNLYSHPFADFALEALIAFGGWWYLRSRGPAPAWVLRWTGIAALLALQGTMDAVSYIAGPLKPNGCRAMFQAAPAE